MAALLLALHSAAGCASAPPVHARAFAPRLPELTKTGTSWAAVASTCAERERLLLQTASARGDRHRVATVVLAAAAGSLGLGTAVYAGRAAQPSADVLVTTSALTAALAAPLVVLLAVDDGRPAVEQELRRVHDQADRVEGAYAALLEAGRNRDRAVEAQRVFSASSQDSDAARRRATAAPEPGGGGGGEGALVDVVRRALAEQAGRKKEAPKKDTAPKDPADALVSAAADADAENARRRAAIARQVEIAAARLDGDVRAAQQRVRDADKDLELSLRKLGELCGRRK